MKKLQKALALSLVALFFMSMANSKSLLVKVDPFEDCVTIAELDYELNGDFESAMQVYDNCVDDIISDIGN